MADVLLARKADSKGYTRLLLADPIGQPQAGEVVRVELRSGGEFTIAVAGQKEFDIPADAKTVTFPDGDTWSPKK